MPISNVSVNRASEPSTISDIEKAVQNGLEALRHAPLNLQITTALQYLAPPGYRPVAQLEEDGRKKRSTAAASNWNPATGEIVIYFEPLEVDLPGVRKAAEADTHLLPPTAQPVSRLLESEAHHGITRPPETPSTMRPKSVAGTDHTPTEPASSTVSSTELQQCCDALREAEKAGKLFIAFKWFRDEALSKCGFDWSASADARQRILAAAVESGAIQVKKINNPKNPDFPTTVISLNRGEPSSTSSPRFNPIKIKGEPLSVTIMRDRGSN